MSGKHLQVARGRGRLPRGIQQGHLHRLLHIRGRGRCPVTIESIKARLEAATEGPWVVKRRGEIVGHPNTEAVTMQGELIDWICHMQCSNMPNFRNDANLIAHAPTDLRALLKVAEAAKGRVKCVYTYSQPECAACLDRELCAALTELEGME